MYQSPAYVMQYDSKQRQWLIVAVKPCFRSTSHAKFWRAGPHLFVSPCDEDLRCWQVGARVSPRIVMDV